MQKQKFNILLDIIDTIGF